MKYRTYIKDDFTIWNNDDLGSIPVIYLDGDFWTLTSDFVKAIGLKSYNAYKDEYRNNHHRIVMKNSEDEQRAYSRVITNTNGMNYLLDSLKNENAPKWKDWLAQQIRKNRPQDASETAENAIIPTINNPVLKFTSEAFGEIRVMEIDGEPWFVGKDVAEILGYTNPSKALIDHIDAEDKLNNESLSSLGQRGGWLINESGLYSLILSSKLPTAKQFKKWVTGEVLPSIRKTGLYAVDELLNNPDLMIAAMERLKEERAKNAELTRLNTELSKENANLIETNGDLSATNAALVEKNKELTTENNAINIDTMTWDWRTIVNALIRSYSGRKYYGKMMWGWGDFVRGFNKRFHTSIRRRRPEGDKSMTCLDLVKEDEQTGAVRVAVALCKEVGLDYVKIINEVNAGHFTEESED